MTEVAEDEVAVSGFPSRMGRYELLVPLGAGGMATVFLARMDVGGGVYREVAVKLLHPQLRLEQAAAIFLDEARIAARIRHPNVVPVLEVGDIGRGGYLAMEYVEGDTLAALLRSAKLRNVPVPQPVMARILNDALCGLHAAHELTDQSGAPLDVVHRDFSPQNILVGVDGVTRLTDFGIAKGAGRVQSTASGAIKGKLSYMPPEQVRAQPLDRRTDIWAAGVVAWEMLAGRRLYEIEDQAAIMMTVVNTPPPALASVQRGLPAELSQVIAGALRLRREERYATADDFRKRLFAAWRANEGIAEPEEVAAFVRRATEEVLRKRREQIAHVLQLRAASDAISSQRPSEGRPTAGSTLAITPRSQPIDASASTDQSSAWGRSIGLRRRFGLPLAALGLVALGLGGATLWRFNRSVSAVTPSVPPITSASASPELARPDASASNAVTEPLAPAKPSAAVKPPAAPAARPAKPRSRPQPSRAFPSLAPPDYK